LQLINNKIQKKKHKNTLRFFKHKLKQFVSTSIFISSVSHGNTVAEKHFRGSVQAKNAGESSLELRDCEARERSVDYRSRRIINCLQRGTMPRHLISRPYRTCRRSIYCFDQSVFSVASSGSPARARANRQLIDRSINHPGAFVPQVRDYSGCYPASDCTVPESIRSIAHRAVASRQPPLSGLHYSARSVLRVLLHAAPRGKKLNRSFRRYIAERTAL
jgi:hypothetical protein